MIALSTVGMAAYSALALLGGPCAPAEISAFCADAQRFPVETDELEAALARLVELGRVARQDGQDGPLFTARGPRGYVVRGRDRRDEGEPDGGWQGWVIDGPGGRVLLDQVVS